MSGDVADNEKKIFILKENGPLFIVFTPVSKDDDCSSSGVTTPGKSDRNARERRLRIQWEIDVPKKKKPQNVQLLT